MSGKMERIVGTMVCSQSLKNKGAEKERAAQAHQSQRLELSEAERLEQEALVRRGRAVAHGMYIHCSILRRLISNLHPRCTSR